MATIYLRYRNLVERGLVKSRQELKRLQDGQGFPLGRLLGPNARVWTDEEIMDYIASRPVKMPAASIARCRQSQARTQAGCGSRRN
jgi:hypothetical protein